jgi:acyl carrier protein
MTRDEVLELIRNHLADELGIDPVRIDPETRFREDLAVDSLDLYTVIQELEDTYGIKISDEDAVQLQTVEATVDFVLSHAAER